MSAETTKEYYLTRVRVQMLFPLNGVIRALWKFQYSRPLKKLHNANNVVLVDHAYHRINAHDGLIDYTYQVQRDCTNEQREDEYFAKSLSQIGISFHSTKFTIIPLERLRDHLHKAHERTMKRIDYLNSLLLRHVRGLSSITDKSESERESEKFQPHQNQQTQQPQQPQQQPQQQPPNNRVVTFWKDGKWWLDQILAHRTTQHWWPISNDTEDTEDERKKILANQDFRRICRYLNHLTRTLLDEYQKDVTDETEAVEILLNCTSEDQNMLNKLYVEPSMASLFAAYLSTAFMSHKQQHGLNTKHAAAKHDNTNVQSTYRSERDFDPKIYLDMCSSCDKKDIFELMLKLKRSHHPSLPCNCSLCSKLCSIANAWQFYNCVDEIWLRLEFNRKFYHTITSLINNTCVESPGSDGSEKHVQLVFLSYKNEFTTRETFISNFVNYYTFYENDEQPLSRKDYYSELREKASILFVFAVVNWELILRTIRAKVPHNSISLNQQSIFKSMDNTLYAIFSENSINRMSKERKQTLLNINAPYVNRGFGALPNNGINAVTTTILP